MKKKFKITNNNNNNNLNSDSKDNISKIKPEKIKENENYISYNILNLILSKSNIPKTVIEEINSELYYETLTGKGLITFINNLKYEGYIKNGILQSQNESTLTFKDGTIYTGEIKNNKISGKGKYFFPTGSTYTGEVLNGYRNGKGIYNTIEGISYEGEWKNGLKHGKGKMINNEIIYDGEWYNGNMHGNGKLIWKNNNNINNVNHSNNIYNGSFKFNKIIGNGCMIWNDRNEKYFGYFNDGKQDRYGIHIWFENKGEIKLLRNRYVGEWRKGKRCVWIWNFFYAK